MGRRFESCTAHHKIKRTQRLEGSCRGRNARRLSACHQICHHFVQHVTGRDSRPLADIAGGLPAAAGGGTAARGLTELSGIRLVAGSGAISSRRGRSPHLQGGNPPSGNLPGWNPVSAPGGSEVARLAHPYGCPGRRTRNGGGNEAASRRHPSLQHLTSAFSLGVSQLRTFRGPHRQPTVKISNELAPAVGAQSNQWS